MKFVKMTVALLAVFALLLTGCSGGEKSLSVQCAVDPGDYRPGSQLTVHVQVENTGSKFKYVGALVDQFGSAELTLVADGAEYSIKKEKLVSTDDATERVFYKSNIATHAYRFAIPEDAPAGIYDLTFWVFGQKTKIANAVTILPADSAPGPVVDTDPQPLTAAKAAEIENAWYTATGATLGTWCVEGEDSFTDGVRYYGSYAGFDILFRPTGDDAITDLEVEGVTFSHNTGFELYAYQDGSFMPLQEICTVGAISSAELKELSLRHLFYETRVERPMIPSSTPTITMDVQQGMKVAFLQQFVTEEGHTAAELTVSYYGEYGGAHVGFINGILMYTQALTSETVGGVTFRYNTGQKLLVYYEGELMHLGEAYDRGILTQEHLTALHNVYAPKDDSLVTE